MIRGRFAKSFHPAAAKAATLLAALFAAGCTAERFAREDEQARFNRAIAERTAAQGLVVGTEGDPGIAAAKTYGPEARLLSLAECERIAVENHLPYRVTLLSARLKDEAVRASYAALLPRGRAEFGARRRSNEPLIASSNGPAAFEDRETERFSIGLVLPVFDFGAAWMAASIAKDERMRERLAVLRARQTLLRDVRVAYVRFAGALRDVELLDSEVAAATESLRVARSLEREGLSSAVDSAYAEATLARAERDLAIGRRDLMLVRSALGRTMSVPVWAAFRVAPGVDAPPEPPRTPDAVRALEQLALSRRPEPRAQDFARSIAAADARRAFAALFPRIDASFDFEWSSNSKVVNPSFFAGGVSVAHALLDGTADLWRLRAAEVAVDVQSERALLTAMAVVYEVDLRVLELLRAFDGIAAGERLDAAEEQLFAREQSRYREGLASAADVARALASRHAAARDLNRVRVEAQVAWHELRTATADDATEAPDAEADLLPLAASPSDPAAPRAAAGAPTETRPAASRPGAENPR